MKKIIKYIKRIVKVSFALAILCLISALLSVYYVKQTASKHLYSKVEEIPHKNVGLVLGTSKYGRKGGLNPYFKYRMEAAFELFSNNKIDHVIVSGDNHIDGYNEPQQMKDYLIDLGVDEKNITLDYAGLRTFDSMVRAKEVFNQKSITIISQKFHNERAVFISKENDMDAIGFNAKSPILSKQMKVREFLAKFKAVLDIYLLKTKPKFLGEKIEIDL